MENKMLVYIVAAILVLLLIGSIVLSSGILNRNTTKNSGPKQINPELEKYRSEDIPEECRLPAGNDPESWKQHLGHHQNTLYCLDYYTE